MRGQGLGGQGLRVQGLGVRDQGSWFGVSLSFDGGNLGYRFRRLVIEVPRQIRMAQSDGVYDCICM